MKIDKNHIKELLQQPSEGLQVELKSWLDPRNQNHVATLVKAIFAIRNRNGGLIIIGYDDATQLPDIYDLDESVESLYHIDNIQGLVSRYAYVSFEIAVPLIEHGGQRHPVIVVPDGVRVPVIVKRDLVGNNDNKLLQRGNVYFRTLQSNGTPSSSRLSPGDYSDLLDICFENREADIGRFFRRHLSGIDNHFVEALLGVGSTDPVQQSRDRAFALIEEGTDCAEVAAQEFGATAALEEVQEYLTMRVGLVLDPPKPDELPTEEFLNRVFASNPQYTGWPIWLDSRAAANEAHRPYVLGEAWQALIIRLEVEPFFKRFEFMRFDPKGEFYLQRVMQEDFRLATGTVMDVVLMIYRVTEVLAVGLSIARNIGWDSDSTACFAFRWTGLSGRMLSSWANPLWYDVNGGTSHNNEAEAFVRVPLEVSHSALAPYVATAVGTLFASFDGYNLPQEIIEKCVQKLIERKMDST